VTCVFAGTVSVSRLKAMFWAEMESVTGGPEAAVGPVVAAGGGEGCAGGASVAAGASTAVAEAVGAGVAVASIVGAGGTEVGDGAAVGAVVGGVTSGEGETVSPEGSVAVAVPAGAESPPQASARTAKERATARSFKRLIPS
jgi:hypothetical protein